MNKYDIKSNTKKLIIEINRALHEDIEKWAKRRGITIRKYVTQAIIEHLSKEVWQGE